MNKKPSIILWIIVVIIVLTAAFYVFRLSTVHRLDQPDSIVYHPGLERFLISNSGNGSITAMDLDGELESFMSKAFSQPKGLMIRNDLLYVVDPNQVHLVDAATKTITESIAIEGASDLKDIAMDEFGKLYITDLGANCVWIYDPASKSQEKLMNQLFDKPSGIYYDRPRWQMFIVNYAQRSPIISLDIRDKEVKIFMDSVYSLLDGIAVDDLGRIYISSWQEETVFEIPQEQNRFIDKYPGLKSPGGLYYHLPTNELFVPLFHKNQIERLKLD